MSAEQQDITQFVTMQAPFSMLEASACSYFVKHLDIAYLNRENQAQWLQSDHPKLFLIRSGLYDLVDSKGDIVTRLAQGDYFGFPSLLTGEAMQNRLEVQKEGIVYMLPQESFDYLRREYKPFEQYFVRAHANRLLSSHYKSKTESWSERKISELMTRKAITLTPDSSIRHAAKQMQEYGVSSIMITQDAHLVGVVTDRDLRNRVLADEVDPQQSVSSIMTAKPKFIFENNRVFSALHLMLKHNIHHIPVLDENHKPLGMITSTDLLRQQKSDPVQLIGRIYKARAIADLKRYAKEIPELLRGFSYNIDDISLIGKLLSGLTDALTSRLIYLYQQEHGVAPSSFSFICFGSQAREEQTLHSDQDNGLLLPDGLNDDELAYFKGMGEYVCENLVECGIRRCPGNIMASSELCRMSISDWRERFFKWISSPTPQAMLNCKIFFDLRFIEGSHTLYSKFYEQLTHMSRNELFYAAMANDIDSNSVPIGLFNNFKTEKTEKNYKYIDLKKRGVVIINDIVRLYALRAGIRRANTQERLDALLKHTLLSKEDIYNLKDCWRFLTQLRLSTQINQEGLPSNCINPDQLNSLERHQLKEAFYLVKQAQQAAVFKFARGSL
ncbi:CBS domain-containing protein [Pseudoalteromonas sp. SG44-5]|uniref:putative nucleotidyltransferase substrate binding domain-containing protein n=1 Tax=unclassified Pseudoalteromonas TaxID=194690 RepID=UPI0015F96058|nr:MULTISPECIES: putative nucleotidyltransferase substrate binding domain-containing protein [unclassified Pseudoalteromonas]MBB1405414.1 CBS domain-containing protein [Pseudoalteromonas sp. SG44-5]MBH0092451.1 CBS domain-containing protein [Pseudoalteromonas sp. SCQQ13]